MKAVIFERFGEPAEVLQVRDVPAPEPGPGQVRVRMIASPINPSDLLVVRGVYGRLPTLPATPGFEGVGVVEAAGPGILGWLRRGRRVAVLNGQGGNWQEQVVVPSRQVVPIADGVPDDQAAAFFVNPATALAMTRWILGVPRGAWFLQTAAGSSLGQMLIRLAKRDGYRTINVIRRMDQAAHLNQLGSDAIICTAQDSIEERVRAITGGEGVHYAVDAVGGETGSQVVKALGEGGRLLVYGTLSNQPLSTDSRVLMVGNKRVEGFWLSNWVRKQSALTMLRLFRSINQLLLRDVLTSPIAASFYPEQIADAVRLADTPARPGKILLKFGKTGG